MIIKIFFISSFVLLWLGLFFWLRDHRRFSLPTWRKILVWLGITVLAISLFTYPDFFLECTVRQSGMKISRLVHYYPWSGSAFGRLLAFF